jgi:hypothetical protein
MRKRRNTYRVPRTAKLAPLPERRSRWSVLEPILAPGPPPGARSKTTKGGTMRSVLLYLLGVPIPIILLLAMCTHHF